MVIELNYSYILPDSKYDELINLVANKKEPNRANDDMWLDFVSYLEYSVCCSADPTDNRAMYKKVLEDIKTRKNPIIDFS